ncbi:septum formation initiator [Kineosporia babensis]
MLLLTAEPLLVATVERLAAAYGVGVQVSSLGVSSLRAFEQRTSVVGSGVPPALVLVGADHEPAAGLPASASGVPRLLLAVGPPHEGLWRSALELRAEQVVLLPEGEHLLEDRLARLGSTGALTLGVIGGCGGAGASVLAAALARTAAAATPTLLVEMDGFSGGADLLLGAEDEPGLRWPDLASARGRLLPGSLATSLPLIDGVHVLASVRAGPPLQLSVAAVGAVLDSARSEFGVVVVDLPRHLDEASSAAVRALDACLAVVPSEVRAVASAQRVAASLRPLVGDLRAVVRGPAPSGLSPLSICSALDLPLAGLLPPEPRLRAALERGEPPGLRERGPLARFCRELLGPELPGARTGRRGAAQEMLR